MQVGADGKARARRLCLVSVGCVGWCVSLGAARESRLGVLAVPAARVGGRASKCSGRLVRKGTHGIETHTHTHTRTDRFFSTCVSARGPGHASVKSAMPLMYYMHVWFAQVVWKSAAQRAQNSTPEKREAPWPPNLKGRGGCKLQEIQTWQKPRHDRLFWCQGALPRAARQLLQQRGAESNRQQPKRRAG